jgi:hypothetical protein
MVSSVPTKSRRARRRARARALCLGLASVLAISGSTAPAGAQEGPSVMAHCDLGLFGEFGFLGFTGLPPNEQLYFLAVARGPQRTEVYNIFFNSANGTVLSGQTPDGPPNRPVDIGVTVYRDLNGNGLWDFGVDDTLFRGSGTLVDCPSGVPIAPK